MTSPPSVALRWGRPQKLHTVSTRGHEVPEATCSEGFHGALDGHQDGRSRGWQVTRMAGPHIGTHQGAPVHTQMPGGGGVAQALPTAVGPALTCDTLVQPLRVTPSCDPLMRDPLVHDPLV